MYKKIGIIGATGMLGKPVVNALLAAGFEVYSMVRDIIKAKIELPIGVNLIVGDIGNPVDIENFLKQVEAVHLNLSIQQNELEKEFHTEDQGLKLLLDIAKRRGIKRVSYLSSLLMNFQGTNGFKWWVFDVKLNAVKQVKSSGIPYTIFYPSTFMENIFYRQKKGDKIRLAGTSKYKMFFISADDYAKQVANSYRLLGEENRDYPVQGLFPYTSDEAASIFIKFYKKEVLSIQKLPFFVLSFLARFSQRFNYLSNIVFAMNHYSERFQAELTWRELGKPIITIEQYAANHK